MECGSTMQFQLLPDEDSGCPTALSFFDVRLGEDLDLDVLQAWCRDRFSEYKIPRRFLVVESLPRNAMGKVTKPAVQ